MRFEGIYVPVVTPYRDDFSIDRDRLVEVIDYLVEAGVQGIVLAGTTGEYYAQSMEERVSLMPLAKDALRGRLPLIIGTGAIRTEESIAVAEAARSAGADGILVTSPAYALPTESENAAHALAIDKAAGLPIMLYNYPGRMGVAMGETYLDLVSRSASFCAIKESSGDINRVHLLATRYPSIDLSCGMDDQALEFFVWGARSWVAAGANFAPEAHIALYQACAVQADFIKGRRIMEALLPLMSVLEQGGAFVQCIKHGLSLRGLPVGPPRPPLLPLSEEAAADLEHTIRDLDQAIAGL